MSNIDRYAKFISEQARIARLDGPKQLSEEWTAHEVNAEPLHPDNDGRGYGGHDPDVPLVSGKLHHTDGHTAEFVRSPNGVLSVDVHHAKTIEIAGGYAELQRSAEKAAQEICDKHDGLNESKQLSEEWTVHKVEGGEVTLHHQEDGHKAVVKNGKVTLTVDKEKLLDRAFIPPPSLKDFFAAHPEGDMGQFSTYIETTREAPEMKRLEKTAREAATAALEKK
jgi:hypothetical protein